MGAWRWIRDVIAATGEHEPVAVSLEHAGPGDYVLRLGVRAGFGAQEVGRIPITSRPNPAPHPVLKEIHECEVAGQRIEAANLYALRAKVARLLDAIAPGRTLPLCYFRAPAMDYELPVYEDRGMLVCPVLGGPKLRAHDLAGIRNVASRYLVSAGYLAEPDQMAVDVVRPRDLKRVPPAAVFRSPADERFWLPAVEGTSPAGAVVGVVAQPAELRGRRFRRPAELGHEAPAAPDVVALLRYLRTELERARSNAAEGLWATDVQPEIWSAAGDRTEDAALLLVAHLADGEDTRLELEVRRASVGDLTVAVEDHGINVFLAADAEGLAAQVGRHLVHHEFLQYVEEVEVQAAGPPRADRLEVESITIDETGSGRWPLAETHPPEVIRTRFAGDGALAADEEVHAPWR